MQASRIAQVLAIALAAACAGAVPVHAGGEHHSNQRVLYPRDASPFGKSMSTWAETASQWVYAQPYDRSPLFDPTGANCAVDQHGPVWYIARIAGPPVFSGTRQCSIPRGKSVLLYIGAVVDSYPCPDPDFEPAPGQSLYEFLRADAAAAMDTVNRLEVSLDGRPIRDVFAYRYASENLFAIKGDPSLRLPFDGCITGAWQPAVVDGFFMMFKPLSPGRHTLIVHGTNTIGHDKTFTYYLTVP
ncbi:hypothetical protein [Lysobacter sp. CA199]|uniref:hypothetical protein n=1 Tax=Lysobacter sp. CA199 TaxID=3455608 RepID=UPI003F8D85CF